VILQLLLTHNAPRLYLDAFGDKWHRTAVVGEWKGPSAGG
jgi:hypothetical protein